MTTKAKPENFPWVSPYIAVSDADKSIEFYQKAYGFTITDKVTGEDGSTWHAELSYKGQILMIGKAGSHGGKAKPPAQTGVESPISLYFYTENVDEFYKAAVVAGAESMLPPEDVFWGDRMCRLKDPDGYDWAFATNIQQK